MNPRVYTPLRSPHTVSLLLQKNTSASALRTALSPLSENPGTEITTEELALPLLLLPQTHPKTREKWPPLSSCLINLLSGHHAESSVNQVSVFLLLPVWPEKASQELFLKGTVPACRRGHGFAPNYPWDVRCGLKDDSNKAEMKWSKSRSIVSNSVTPRTIQSMEFSRPTCWSCSLSLLQGIFPTQASNPGLPLCRQILYQLSHKGSPGILEWVDYPFSSRSSQPRNQIGVSCIAGGFFTNKLSGKPTQSRSKGYRSLSHWSWNLLIFLVAYQV